MITASRGEHFERIQQHDEASLPDTTQMKAAHKKQLLSRAEMHLVLAGILPKDFRKQLEQPRTPLVTVPDRSELTHEQLVQLCEILPGGNNNKNWSLRGIQQLFKSVSENEKGLRNKLCLAESRYEALEKSRLGSDLETRERKERNLQTKTTALAKLKIIRDINSQHRESSKMMHHGGYGAVVKKDDIEEDGSEEDEAEDDDIEETEEDGAENTKENAILRTHLKDLREQQKQNGARSKASSTPNTSNLRFWRTIGSQ